MRTHFSGAAPFEVILKIAPAYRDARGNISNIFTDMPFRHLAVIDSCEGAIRGNHVHPGEQWMYLISGRYISYSGPDAAHLKEQEVVPGDLVYCPPNAVHAYRFLEDSVFLNVTLDDREPDRYSEHTQKVEVIA